MVCFKSRISLLIFCLDDLPIDDSGVLKSPPTTMANTVLKKNKCAVIHEENKDLK
jgi:hypothetical protein